MRSINFTKKVLVLLITILVLVVILMILYFLNNMNLTHGSDFTKPVYSNENKLYTYFDDYGYYNLEIAGNTWFNEESNSCFTPLSYQGEKDVNPTFLSNKNTRSDYLNINSANSFLVLTDKFSYTWINRDYFINNPCYKIWHELDKGTPKVFFDEYFPKTSDGYYILSSNINEKYPFKYPFSLKKIPVDGIIKIPYKTSSKLNVDDTSNIKKGILTFAVTIFNPEMSEENLTLKIIAPSGKEYDIDVFNDKLYHINYDKIKGITEENILGLCDIVPTENKEECLEDIESMDLSKVNLLDFYVGTIDITDIINIEKGGNYRVEIDSNLELGKPNKVITSFPFQADWQITAIEENKEKVKEIKYARIDSGNVGISGGETKEFKFSNNNLDINGKSKFSVITSDGDKNENDSLINYKNEMLEIENREKNDFFNSTAYDITNSTKYMYGMDAFNKTFNSSNLIDSNGLSFKIKKENNTINDKLYLRNIALVSDVKKPNINISANVINTENININITNTGANLCDEQLSIILDKNIIDIKNLIIKGNCENNNIKYDKSTNTIDGSINLNNGCSLNISFSAELKDKKEESKIISKVTGKAAYGDKCFNDVKTEKEFVIKNNENTIPLSASIKYTSEKIISNITTHNNTNSKKCNCKMFVDIDKNIKDIENIIILRKLNNNQIKEINDYKMNNNTLEINIGAINEGEKIEVTYDNIINNYKIANLNTRLEYYESNNNICDTSDKENIKISIASDSIDLSKYIDVPITDSYKSYLIYAIGAILIAAGVILLIYYRKNK